MTKISKEEFEKNPQPGRWKVENGFYVKIEDVEEARGKKQEVKSLSSEALAKEEKSSGSDDPDS